MTKTHRFVVRPHQPPPETVCETPNRADAPTPVGAGGPPRPDLPPDTAPDGFRVERVIGAGGMGAVYLATDARLGRQVALKTMRPELAADPDARARFVREARATAAIDHENVVPVYAVGECNGTPYLVMPLLRGEALNARLLGGAWPTLAEACRVARDVAAGLAAAHAAGLVHRDVKPSNVWLDAGGRARLLDFGLARQARGGDGVTRAGAVVGTPEYMAPEQAAGGPVDARTDLFSLGVLVYELATGTRPFGGDSVMAVLTKLAVHHPPSAGSANPAVPPPLSALIARLLAKAPADRPGSAAEVRDELNRIAAGLAAPRPSVWRRAAGWFGFGGKVSGGSDI